MLFTQNAATSNGYTFSKDVNREHSCNISATVKNFVTSFSLRPNCLTKARYSSATFLTRLLDRISTNVTMYFAKRCPQPRITVSCCSSHAASCTDVSSSNIARDAWNSYGQCSVNQNSNSHPPVETTNINNF